MIRKVLVLIGILILGMTVSAYAASTDAPHNQTNLFACGDCHSYGDFPGDEACLSCHINTGGGGYSKTNAPKMLVHSSATTSTKYGTWTTECKSCHQGHTQQQKEVYQDQTFLVTGTITSVSRNTTLNTTTYGYSSLSILNPDWALFTTWGKKSANQASGNERGLIMFPDITLSLTAEVKSATSSTITVTGFPGTVAVGRTFALVYGQMIASSTKLPGGSTAPVKFFNNKGANSFAYDESGTGTDTTVDGICQVCHTKTTAWRADGTLSGVGIHAGKNGSNCIDCHKHEKGFAAGCTDCHGFPPVAGTPGGPNGLVDSPAPTGSQIAGAHDTHANTLGLDCTVCHYNSKGSGTTHNDGTIQAVTMGFYLFGGAVQGGAYNGQAGVDYNTTLTSPATTVTSPGGGAKQCSNIYCHSTGQGTNGGALAGGDYKTPAWDGTVACGDCHRGEGNGNLMNSGSHTPHFTSLIRTDCDECHNGFGSGSAQHINYSIGVAFQANPGGGSGSYTGGTTPGNHAPGGGYGSCSNAYCHSIVQKNNGAALTAGDYRTVTWGNTNSVSCGDCHGNALLATGSHSNHLATYECYNCHDTAGDNTNKHADRNIDIIFRNGGAYSQLPNTPGNGYGNCSTTWCHGTTSPIWGTDLSGYDTCTRCHGTPTAAPAPSYAKAPSGTHQNHLQSTIGKVVACDTCHIVPATVQEAGHIDSSLPAEVKVATGYSGGTCANACHGNPMPRGTTQGANRTPSWADSNYLNGDPNHDCAQCHGYPPASIGAHAGTGPADCITCHSCSGINAAGTGFGPGTNHIDGVLCGGGDECLDCHSSLSSTHGKHTDGTATGFLAGKSLSGVNYGQAWFYDTSYVSGAPKFSCGYCHPNTSATHMNGVRNLNIDPNDAAAVGTVKAKNGYPTFTQNSGVSVTCASVYCHSTGYDDGTGYVYQTTPDWYATDPWASVDKCSQCHGNSPNNGKPGSLSHYNPDAMGMGVVGGHFVGIHYNNVYDKANGGLIKDASTRQNAHGTASTSTTINCNTCHNQTVTMSANDLNQICATCHAAAPQATMVIAAGSIKHINGQPDVAFDPLVASTGFVRSKAQLRNSSLPEQWTRFDVNGNSLVDDGDYKTAGAHDISAAALNIAAGYNPGTKSCSSVACHNGNLVQWGATNVTCNSCHTSLP